VVELHRHIARLAQATYQAWGVNMTTSHAWQGNAFGHANPPMGSDQGRISAYVQGAMHVERIHICMALCGVILLVLFIVVALFPLQFGRQAAVESARGLPAVLWQPDKPGH
jgi:hypothetical protein